MCVSVLCLSSCELLVTGQDSHTRLGERKRKKQTTKQNNVQRRVGCDHFVSVVLDPTAEAQLHLISLTFGGASGGPPFFFIFCPWVFKINKSSTTNHQLTTHLQPTEEDFVFFFFLLDGISLFLKIVFNQTDNHLESLVILLIQLFNSSVVLNHLYAAHVIIIFLKDIFIACRIDRLSIGSVNAIVLSVG